METIQSKAYATHSSKSELKPFSLERRKPLDHDVQIEIKYCGVCHSDIHMARGEWGETPYPLVPGHEIIGKVVAVGNSVSSFKIGDLVGVGCMVDSCGECRSCKEHSEQYCENGSTMTYASPDKNLGGFTYGGYSDMITVNEDFVLRVSEKLDTKAVAPLLCAGITTYSPLKQCNVKKGDKVGVIGLGGLGHMAIKFAKAMGAHVVMVTTSLSKAEDSKRLGADEVLISKDEKQMEKHLGSFDVLINTIPVGHDLDPYIGLLRSQGTMMMVGAIEPLKGLNGAGLIIGGKKVIGSLIGGIKETQEMLDFCAEHNIVSDIEMINIQDINKAYDRVVQSDVKYRFVIDMESLKTMSN